MSHFLSVFIVIDNMFKKTADGTSHNSHSDRLYFEIAKLV